jgi:hypothetical protein
MGGERMSDRDGAVPGAVGTDEVAANGATPVTKEGRAGWTSVRGEEAAAASGRATSSGQVSEHTTDTEGTR